MNLTLKISFGKIEYSWKFNSFPLQKNISLEKKNWKLKIENLNIFLGKILKIKIWKFENFLGKKIKNKELKIEKMNIFLGKKIKNKNWKLKKWIFSWKKKRKKKGKKSVLSAEVAYI